MSHAALSPEQFHFIQAGGSTPEQLSSYHQIRHPEERKTMMAWHKDTGKIFTIETAEHQRRQGMATAMWNRAHQEAGRNPDVVAPVHSEIRSGMGDKWAHAVGGVLPERDLERSYRGDE